MKTNSQTQAARRPSQNPPCGLDPVQVPQFVVFGFDDNGISGLPESGKRGGLQFILDVFGSHWNPGPDTGEEAASEQPHRCGSTGVDSGTGSPTFDGEPTTATFYGSSMYVEADDDDKACLVRRQWSAARAAGHEIGCHTHDHPYGESLAVDEWTAEIERFFSIVERPFDPAESVDAPNPGAGPGIPRGEVAGFRTPFIEFNANTFEAVRAAGFVYDCSIEEGFQPDQDGTNYVWPYTLNFDSPGAAAVHGFDPNKRPGQHPGLWELPVYAYLVPGDDECRRYGIEPGFGDRLRAIKPDFDGKITGFDWNLWVFYRMRKNEFVGVLKYSLDQRLRGNRCPFMVGVHSDIYSEAYDEMMERDGTVLATSFEERMDGFREFFEYALSDPRVRIVNAVKCLEWLRKPAALGSR